jgi:hypothetical protein
MTIKTRKQYMNKEISFDDYYGQFVNPATMKTLETFIGKEKIIKSKDEHFNNIDLQIWDNLPLNGESSCLLTFANTGQEASQENHKVTYIYSISDKVCIYKTAAKIMRDSAKV